VRFAKMAFLAAGVWGLIVVVPLFFLYDYIGSQYPPAVTHPDIYYGFVTVTLAWQVAFLLISRDPLRFRPLIPAAMIEKFAYVIALAVLHSYGGGIRISSTRNPKVTPFGQVIVGGATASAEGEESTTAFTLTAGGGVNVPVNDRWGVRAQADYRGIFFEEEDGDRVDAARVVVGVYFALGQ